MNWKRSAGIAILTVVILVALSLPWINLVVEQGWEDGSKHAIIVYLALLGVVAFVGLLLLALWLLDQPSSPDITLTEQINTTIQPVEVEQLPGTVTIETDGKKTRPINLNSPNLPDEIIKAMLDAGMLTMCGVPIPPSEPQE